jgi:hypothetical protein
MSVMSHRVLVIGHADADGYIIAEQTRRNLAQVKSFDVDVVVDPRRTKDHKAWLNLDQLNEIDRADYVFFVDLMFAPATYAAEARALTDFVRRKPKKRFFLVDHHPLPLQRLEMADNLRAVYRSDVAECAIGPLTGMMVVAALCEPQPSEVAKNIKEPLLEDLAKGMKRAAAPGGPLDGKKLSALLRADCWDAFLELGRDDAKFHRLPRGRRPSDAPQSKVMMTLERAASDLLAHRPPKSTSKVRMNMAYDVASAELSYDTGRAVLQKNAPSSPKDLGVIATLLEVAALSLTTEQGKIFTIDDLIREVQEIGGEDAKFDKNDVKIVLHKAGFLKKVAGGYQLR